MTSDDKLEEQKMHNTGSGKGGRAALLVLLAWALCQAPARADALDDALRKHSPRIKQHLIAQKAGNVGVLKFKVAHGKGPLQFAAGTLNHDMETRLTLALLRSLNPTEDEHAINLICNATETAQAFDRKASYLDFEGRKKLFTLDYPTLVGGQKVKADTFLTGKVYIDAKAVRKELTINGKPQPTVQVTVVPGTTTVMIGAFTKQEPEKIDYFDVFEVKTDRAILSTGGRGVLLNRAAASSLTSAEPPPGPIRSAPVSESAVSVHVKYGKTKQALKPAEGTDAKTTRSYTVPTPKLRQEITITVENKLDQRIAAVVLVNGRNVLFDEPDDEPAKLTRWLIDAKKSATVAGLYKKSEDNKGHQVHPFSVRSEAELRDRLADFAGLESLGEIKIYVLQPGLPGAAGDKIEGGLRAVPLRPGMFASLKDANQSLKERLKATEGGRGFIAASDKAEAIALSYDKLPNAVHTETLIIRYFAPVFISQP